jgi:transposase-like protein
MNEHLDLVSIAEEYNTEEKARAFFERMRWPDGAICPHCGCKNARKVGSVRGQRKGLGGKGKSGGNRPGLWFCVDCKDQFTVTEGTVMECTHIPLNKWLLAFVLLGSSKKGVSAHQLHRTLGIGYRAAWFMAHRVRYAMSQEPLKACGPAGPSSVLKTPSQKPLQNSPQPLTSGAQLVKFNQ